jgi:two-component system, chemotaxis family, protein-glutamate methylesterase/glutaminase
MKRIRVLVVDDSLVMREYIASGLAQDSGIEVVGKAANPYEARDMIVDLEPDVLTMDVEMPRMNGIDFLKLLMPQYPLPVVVVSSLSSAVFDALNAGAVDFVTKPTAKSPREMQTFVQELVVKIKIASMAKVGHLKRSESRIHHTTVSVGSNANTLIAIGASTGGTEAIVSVLKTFAPDMPGTIIVQHMPPVFTRMYAERLNNTCLVEVHEAKDGDTISQGQALIAPGGDRQLRVVLERGAYRVKLTEGEKVSGHCPSVDVMFGSVADAAKKNAVGILLTGMGADGANGLLKMRKNGAYTIGQDEKSSVVYGMPMVAYNIGAVQRQAALEDIPTALMEYLQK